MGRFILVSAAILSGYILLRCFVRACMYVREGERERETGRERGGSGEFKYKVSAAQCLSVLVFLNKHVFSTLAQF